MPRTGVKALACLAALAAAAAPAPARAETTTHELRFGPLDVGPYQVVKGSHDVRTPPVTGAIVRMDAHVVDAAGREVPQSEVMLHHLVFFDRGRPGVRRYDGTCVERRASQRFYGTSEELRPLTLPPGYGYRFDRRDHWRASSMVMNHTHRERRVWVRYRVTVDTDPAIRPVLPYWVGVFPCGADPQYSVRGGAAAGAESVRRASWTVPRAGRIVAVGGHLHGGATRLTLSQPSCDRLLTTSRPMYGGPDDPVYRVRPLLHEPDPLNISWWQSATGVPVARGERLVLGSHYEATRPHMRVMGIAHVYLAPDEGSGPGCGPLPADAEELGAGFAGRPVPPTVNLTLARVGTDGRARPVAGPRAPLKRFRRSAGVRVKNFRFSPPKLSIPAGGRVRWRFGDREEHDVTLVRGPRGFAAPWRRSGGAYERRFTTPGTYRLHCSLHPAAMSQIVRVTPR